MYVFIVKLQFQFSIFSYISVCFSFTQFSYLSPFVIRKSLETIIQNEGDECLHCQSIQYSLLHRHTQLTWNLVWLMYRLGLPTYLLDSLPLWIMNYQIEQRIKFKTNPSHNHRHHHHCSQQCNCNNKQIHNNHSIIFTDALYVSYAFCYYINFVYVIACDCRLDDSVLSIGLDA